VHRESDVPDAYRPETIRQRLKPGRKTGEMAGISPGGMA